MIIRWCRCNGCGNSFDEEFVPRGETSWGNEYDYCPLCNSHDLIWRERYVSPQEAYRIDMQEAYRKVSEIEEEDIPF